jgi:putative transposase
MKLNEVYEAMSDAVPFRGRYRVLWFDAKLDRAVLIHVPNITSAKWKPYFTRPVRYQLSDLEEFVAAGELVRVPFRLAGLFTMSDAKIRDRYPENRGIGGKALARRDTKYEAIEKTIALINEDRRAFFSNRDFNQSITEHANEAKVSYATYRNAVHRYLALACGKNALLPFSFGCGAPGKEREQRRPLGNTSKAYKAGLIESAGFALSFEDKQNLGWGYFAFLKADSSVPEAYDQTMALFWSESDRIVDGQAVPVLLPPHRRPTLEQFENWGPRLFNNEAAWKAGLGFKDYANNYRAYHGSATSGIAGVGQVSVCDATSIDDQLASRFSRLNAIGSAVRMCILEGFSTTITGYHLGLEAPSGQIALLSVLSSATSKVEYCSRFGVEICESDFPAVFSCRYLVDNGEFRTQKVIDTLCGIDSGMELVEVGFGAGKHHGESIHRTFHKKTGHKIKGTTRGRQRKRGEDPPALHACWSIDERTRLDLQAIRYLNTAQPVEAFFDAHPFRAQMKLDGVKPYRNQIHEWGVEQGLVYSPAFHEDKLRGALLPEMRAVIKENGVHLIRPDCGRRSDLIKGPRFFGPRLMEAGLMEKARRKRTIRTTVNADPNDLARVWYADDVGFHELKNVSNDLALTRNGTIQDCLAIQDRDAVERELGREDAEQSRAEFVTMRQTNDSHYYGEKQREIAAQEKRPSQASLW